MTTWLLQRDFPLFLKNYIKGERLKSIEISSNFQIEILLKYPAVIFTGLDIVTLNNPYTWCSYNPIDQVAWLR